MSERLVHAVVVDHDGGELTLACLRSLVASAWPADRLRIVLVDNASTRPVLDRVAEELPSVEGVRSDVNLGFAGGANLGMRRRGDADVVALVNNDATVTPGWLPPLVATLDADDRVGAACPKILLATGAVEVRLTTPTRRRGRGDRRDLGVRLSGVRGPGSAGDTGAPARAQLVEGFWGSEPMPAGEAGAQWTAGHATLRVPVADDGPVEQVALRLAADRDVVVVARSGSRTTSLAVTAEPRWHTVATDAVPVDVVNNVGTLVAPDGYGSDRGWLEVDRGQYDEPADVAAWCGGAVLMSRAFLDDVGLFDERLFMYYEDVELSLRGAARGWRYRTAPTSVVRHAHSATAVEGSPFSFHHNERNRLLVATRYAHAGVEQGTARTVIDYVAATASYARRDIAAPVLRGETPRPEIVGRRLRALGSYAGRALTGATRPLPATPATAPPGPASAPSG